MLSQADKYNLTQKELSALIAHINVYSSNKEEAYKKAILAVKSMLSGDADNIPEVIKCIKKRMAQHEPYSDLYEAYDKSLKIIREFYAIPAND
nr:MAG TPA: hypothetical protein [Caudoviricetes sp.]